MYDDFVSPKYWICVSCWISLTLYYLLTTFCVERRRSDAVRTEPVFLDDNDRAYWRLTCYSDSDMLLQGQLLVQLI